MITIAVLYRALDMESIQVLFQPQSSHVLQLGHGFMPVDIVAPHIGQENDCVTSYCC
jgi:hypothetical protein